MYMLYNIDHFVMYNFHYILLNLNLGKIHLFFSVNWTITVFWTIKICVFEKKNVYFIGFRILNGCGHIYDLYY